MTAARRQAPAPAPASLRQQVVVQLTSILMGGTAVGGTVVGTVASVARALTLLGISAGVAAFVSQLASGATVPQLPFPGGPATEIEEQEACAWLALYLVHAAERLQTAEDEGATASAEERELRWFAQHLDAEERRMRSALHVDLLVKLYEDRSGADQGLLGWRALIDARTTPECRWANGRNFRADRKPVIGWPGAVHRACRCTPAAPRPGAPLIPSA